MSEQKNYQSYTGAPYNFVPLYKDVYSRYNNENELPAHNKITDKLLSGEIEIEITAEGPIFISNGQKEVDFFKNVDGKYAIPGSSFRGLVRSNMQILGFSSIGQDIQDYFFMYRQVGGKSKIGGLENKLKDQYNKVLGVKQINKISVTTNVKAGYIKKQDGKYILIYDKKNDTSKEPNYYILKEIDILKAYDEFKRTKKQNPFSFLINENKSKLQNTKFIPSTDKNGKKIIKGEQNRNYNPFFEKVSFEKSERRITAVGEPNKYKYNGYIISSGYMNNKKVMYIIAEINEKMFEFDIPIKDVVSYEEDYKNKEKLLPNKEFFQLPQEGEIKPVFYINYNGRLYFGFTPYLRLFYDKSIHDGINNKHKNFILDYANSIFGYSNGSSSYKSRVYFEDIIINGAEEFEEKTQLILSSPKPSSCLDYLMQKDKEISTYNTEGFKIRGIKQYWFKNETIKNQILKNTKIATTIRALKSGTNFVGTVKFKNLNEDELGLLLWSIKLNDDCSQNIGQAKPYGYGRIKVKINTLKFLDYKKMYNTDSFTFDIYNTNHYSEYINKYIEKISKELNKQPDEIQTIPTIRDFFIMKTFTPDNKLTRYMDLDKKEYQSRVKLPTVQEIKEPENKTEDTKSIDNNQNNKSKDVQKEANLEDIFSNFSMGGKKVINKNYKKK